MDYVELSPKDKLTQLHDLTPAQNLELAGRLENALKDAGQEFSLVYLQAGEITIGNKMIRFSFMLSEAKESKNWQEYITEDLAESIVKALERIKKVVMMNCLSMKLSLQMSILLIHLVVNLSTA